MRLLLIDGHYYLYRSFHAIQHLRNSSNQPTNALYGVTKAIRRMLQELQPDLAAFVMDGGMPQERLDLQPDYKANRAETPDDLRRQFEETPALVNALGLQVVMMENEEADDVMASYTRQAGNDEVILATNDKDLMQLVNERVRIYQPQKQMFELWGPAEVEAKWGVPPEKIGEILALIGDNADNIPGVPGVGPKTATAWIKEFGSLTNLMTRISEIKSERLRESLRANLAQVERNRTMVRLRTLAPLPVPLPKLLIRPNLEAQIRCFQQFEFKTFLQEAQEAWGKSQPQIQGDLFLS